MPHVRHRGPRAKRERATSGPLAVFGSRCSGTPVRRARPTRARRAPARSNRFPSERRAKDEQKVTERREGFKRSASGPRGTFQRDAFLRFTRTVSPERKRVGRVPAGGSATGAGTAAPVDRAACPVAESARSSPFVAMLRGLFRPRSRRIPDAVLSAGRERPGRRHAEKNEEAARVRVRAGIGFRRSVCGAMMAARSAGGACGCSPSQQGAARPSPFVPSSSACPPVCGARPRGPGPFTEGVVPMRANRPAGGPAPRRARFS